MSAGLIIQLIAVLISISCSLLGVFLVLKNMSMLTDAITHTVLLGIVLGFFVSHNFTSPILIIGATLVGLLTVYLVEVLVNTRMMKEDAAIAVVLSFLFSLAIILVSKYTANIHLDVDAVLLGEIAFAPFHVTNVFGFNVAVGIVTGLIILIINLVFVSLFYKELKISIFDRALASSLGMMPIFVHYILMSLVSVTSVISFEAVGSILLISMMIGPAATSYMISKKLSHMLIISIIIGALSSIIGYHVAVLMDVSIAGSIAVIIGVVFIVVLLLKNMLKRLIG